LRRRIEAVRTLYREEAKVRLSRHRWIEIGVALVLTLAALLFVVWTVWAAESGGMGVANAWVRPTMGEGRTTAAYMTITNNGDKDDVLQSARSPEAKAVELHKPTMTTDGVMQIRQVKDGLPIAAGGTLKLSPGGIHLIVVGLDDALAAGGEFPLTLEFAKSGSMAVMVPVRATAPFRRRRSSRPSLGQGADAGWLLNPARRQK
jgi:copper(I)-binding protein